MYSFLFFWNLVIGGGTFLYLLIMYFCWLDFKVYKNKKSMQVFKVSAFSFLYCLHGILFLQFPSETYAHIAGPIWGLLGTLNYAFYFKMMSQYFELQNSKASKLVNSVLYSSAAISVLGILDYFVSGDSFLIGSKYAPKSIYFQYTNLNLQASEIHMVLLSIVSCFILGSTIYLAQKAFSQPKRDRVLLLGIGLSIIFPIHDVLVYTLDFKYGIALASFTYLVELGRISYRYHKEALEQNQVLKTELAAASAIANVSFIAGSINHDLNNSLTQITVAGSILSTSYSEMLEKDKRFAKLVGRINSSSDRITKLSSNYLRLLRGDELEEMEEVVPFELLEDLKEMYRDKCKKENISFELNNCESSLALYSNRVLIEQVLMNLINNSIDALKSVEEPKITVRVEDLNNNFSFWVEDNGTGIPDNFVSNVFDMGFTTKGKNGNGIGLWVAKAVADKLRGKISYLGGKDGARFKLLVPKID